MAKNLYQKIMDAHTVARLDSGQIQLFIGAHLIHEVTSPQAFAMLDEQGQTVPFPERTFATADHIVPTTRQTRPFMDSMADRMYSHLERNAKSHGIRFFSIERGEGGIVHVVGPEKGITQPGMTIACGDSHTSTHGAFGAIAFGIGTSQVRDVLATQTLAMDLLKVRQIRVDGKLRPGVTAKDVILFIIQKLGVKAGVGYVYEYAGSTFEAMTMEERMTVCNMSIEGGARAGYINPDATTYAFIQGRSFAPAPQAWEQAVAYWESVKSDPDAVFDDQVRFDAADIEPVVTWGITPAQSVHVGGTIPSIDSFSESERPLVREALEYMDFREGQPLKGIPIQVAFIGSCTNGRIEDLRLAASLVKGRTVQGGIRALVVPGSQEVKRMAEAEGLHEIFQAAGFEWREAGCSMCLAMNPDKLQGREICASSSNRNFKGRQGSPSGRTLLMSPAMVAVAAISGCVVDVREYLEKAKV